MEAPAPSEVLGLMPATWDALATIATAVGVVLAGVAAYIAARQYRSGEDARRDQTRPYVVVSVQSSAADESFMDLVIETPDPRQPMTSGSRSPRSCNSHARTSSRSSIGQ